MDFLSHLRRDIEPSLYQHIDDVLTNLLSLPEVLDSDEVEQLHYDRGKQTNDLDLEVKSTSTEFIGTELAHKKPGAEIAHATEKHSIPVQKSVDKFQVISAGQDWHAGKGITTGFHSCIFFDGQINSNEKNGQFAL